MKKKLRTASLCVQGGYEPKNGEPIGIEDVEDILDDIKQALDKI